MLPNHLVLIIKELLTDIIIQPQDKQMKLGLKFNFGPLFDGTKPDTKLIDTRRYLGKTVYRKFIDGALFILSSFVKRQQFPL